MFKLTVCFDKLLLQPEFKSIEKIKTIGATYMAASGLDPKHKSGKDVHGHLSTLCDYALALRETLRNIPGHNLKLRAGISCGPLVGGVIGARKPVYDIWGNTVNEASRMESTGEIGQIQVTKYTQQLVNDEFALEYRGEVEVKGKGIMETWWVMGRLHPTPFDYGHVISSCLNVNSKRKLRVRPAPDHTEPDEFLSNRGRERKKWSLRRLFYRQSICFPCSTETDREPSVVHPFSALFISIKQTRSHIHTHPLYT